MDIKNIVIYDIETIKGCFLVCYYFPVNNKMYNFIVNESTNYLLKLLKFLETNENMYFVGSNNIDFDNQIIEYIWKHKEKLIEQEGKQIAYDIWQKAQDIIEEKNHGGFAPYREEFFKFKQLDLFRIQHFDNKNRRVGLKRLQFEMDWEDVREMNIPHTKEQFTEDELKDLIYYCQNDVKSTYANYLYLIGDTSNEIYKDTDAIELREDLTKLFNINCLNYSNSKYGDEIMKQTYAKELKMNIKDLPKKGTFRNNLVFSKCIPKFIKFKTKDLQQFLRELHEITIGVKDRYERHIEIGKGVHTFALGGLHKKVENKYYLATENEELIDCDVRGYYPKTIIEYEIAPAHLDKKAFVKTVNWLYEERSKLKALVKTNPEYKSLVSGYKESAVSI